MKLATLYRGIFFVFRSSRKIKMQKNATHHGTNKPSRQIAYLSYQAVLYYSNNTTTTDYILHMAKYLSLHLTGGKNEFFNRVNIIHIAMYIVY